MASEVSVGLAVFLVVSLSNYIKKKLKLTFTIKSKMHRASTFPSNSLTLSFSVTSILLLPCPLRPDPDPDPGSRNPPNDLVETTSPDHLPPSAPSGLVKTTSLGRPHTPELAKALTQSYYFSHRPIEVVLRLGLKEELSPSHRAAATRCLITRRPLHAQLVLT